MRDGRLLDGRILEAFDRALSEYAPQVRERLTHPGANEGEIMEAFSSVGLRPSQEALAWWGYFDAPADSPKNPPRHVLPNFEFLSVDMSLYGYKVFRDIAEENAAQLHDPPRDPEEAWGSQWAPVFGIGSGGQVVLDCSRGPGAPSPVRAVYADTIFSPEHAGVFAPSFGELLAAATGWMERGASRYDPERRGWVPFDAWGRRSYAELYGMVANDG